MIRQISITVVAFTIASQSQAQAPDTTTLSAMVISATKTPASRVSLTQPVTVITGDELRSRGITRVSDALRAVPGAMLVQNGSTGSVNTLFMRGGESRYTKVLIDGVAVNAPGGFFDFSHLTVDNIERIEVVRGPASVVYGADAVSGIVQIFTRQGRGPFNGSAEARAGNRGSREITLDANGSSGPLRYSLGGGARRHGHRRLLEHRRGARELRRQRRLRAHERKRPARARAEGRSARRSVRLLQRLTGRASRPAAVKATSGIRPDRFSPVSTARGSCTSRSDSPHR